MRSSEMITAIATLLGVTATVFTALFTARTVKRKTLAEASKAFAEAKKTDAETERTEVETDRIRQDQTLSALAAMSEQVDRLLARNKEQEEQSTAQRAEMSAEIASLRGVIECQAEQLAEIPRLRNIIESQAEQLAEASRQLAEIPKLRKHIERLEELIRTNNISLPKSGW